MDIERQIDQPRLFRASEGRPTARDLQRRAVVGSVRRVRRGVYVEPSAWERLDPRGRHILQVRAALPRLPIGSMISHLSAVALTGLPHIGAWPRTVQVSVPPGTARRSLDGVSCHRANSEPDEPASSFEGVPVAAPVTIAMESARTLPLIEAVVIVDHLLRIGAVAVDELLARAQLVPDRGRAQVERVLGVVDPRHESVGESFAAARFEEIGAPRPVAQHEFRYADGTVDRVDFWFENYGVVIEFDGRQKYQDPQMLRGRRPEDVLWLEKRREDRVRAREEVNGFGRTVWKDLLEPDLVRAVVRRQGIPCT